MAKENKNKKNKYSLSNEVVKPEYQYIRVGTDFFKIIHKIDRFGIVREELKKWNKETLTIDHYKEFCKNITAYDDFIIEPNNSCYQAEIHNCYNLYKKFSHKPKKGDWKWTKILLEHVFGEQFDLALIYLQVLYLYPKQALPILCLISKDRGTGKSTFIDWISVIFGGNFVLINPHDLVSDFNGIYATANIIAIEETIIEKQITIEKLKALSTQKNISTNIKMVQNFMLPFFGKIIIASNNEDKFIRIDDEEIRFWVRKLDNPNIKNVRILEDMIDEIPAFLYHLESMQAPDFSKSRMVFTREEIETTNLTKIKKESKPSLYKELTEHFIDFFNNETLPSTEFIYATPKEIKQKFFNNNNNIDATYIREILTKHFNFEKWEKNNSYKPFMDDFYKTGQPFIIKKEAFFSDYLPKNGENQVLLEQKTHNFNQFLSINDQILAKKQQILLINEEIRKLEEMAKTVDNQIITTNDIPF